MTKNHDTHNAGHEPKHDHAPDNGDIFNCPACAIDSNYSTTPNAADLTVTLIEGIALWIRSNSDKSAHTRYERISEQARVFEDGSDAAASMALNTRSDVIQINVNELYTMCQDAARELRYVSRQAKHISAEDTACMLEQIAVNIARTYGAKHGE